MSKRVRWGTEFEDEDCHRLVVEVGDDFARAPDMYGWMIVVKPENRTGEEDDDKWPMIGKCDKLPKWAKHAPLQEPPLFY